MCHAGGDPVIGPSVVGWGWMSEEGVAAVSDHLADIGGSGHLRVAVQAEWGDCDPAGVAFASRFYTWMDLSSHVLARDLGLSRQDMVPPTLMGFPLVSASAEFLKPVRLGDRLEVRSTVSRIGRTSFGMRHVILRLEGGETVMRGSEERVFIGREAGLMRPRPLSAEMRSVLERYLDPAPTPAAGA